MKTTGLVFYEFETSSNAENIAKKYGYQAYMIERYLKMFGEDETIELLKANGQASSTTIRVNTLKSSSEQLFEPLKRKGYPFRSMRNIPEALELDIEAFNYKVIERKAQSNQKNRDKTRRNKPKTLEFEGDNTYNDNLIDYTRSRAELSHLSWGELDSQEKQDAADKVAEKKKKVKEIKKERIKTATLGSIDEYLMGYYYIQGYASMLPPVFLNPNPNDLVIDMCAAPGGKTTHLAQLMKNKGRIIAIEQDEERVKALNYNLRRCGVENALVLNIDANSIKNYDLKPNRILLDAPCSGEGVIREDPKRKTSKAPGDIKYLMKVQEKLLETAVKIVKSNGFIMYSTCSIAPEENEFIIQKILDNFNVNIVPVNDDFGLPGFNQIFGVELDIGLLNARRYYPHVHNTEGFFYCLLQKT